MRLDVDELTRLRRVGEVAVSPDGSWAAVVVQRLNADDDKYASDVWRVPTDGGPAVQLTRSDAKDAVPRFRADGSLGFLSNRNPRPGAAEPGDDERMQVWLMPAGGGEPTPITDEPLGVTDFAFAGDDLVLLAEVVPDADVATMRKVAADRAKHGPSALLFKRGGGALRHWDHWRPDTAVHLLVRDKSGARRDLTPDARHELRGHVIDQRLAVSPDGRAVAVLWSRIGESRLPESRLRRYELATGAWIDLGGEPMVNYNEHRWAPDGKSLAAVRIETQTGKGDRFTLWRFADGDATGTAVAPSWDTQMRLHGFSRDGGALLCTADHEGTTPVFKVSLGGTVERITATSAGGTHEHVESLPDGVRVVVTRSTQLHPPEVFAVELAPDAAPKPLAALSGFGRERGAAIVDIEEQWTSAEDGERVQYYVIKPRGVAKPPVLFWIHGGPVGQFGDGWHWRWNTLAAASAGYAIVMPNARGSSGRGQKFIDAVYGNEWGGQCYRDLMAVADVIDKRSDLDGERMVAMGGSFGGYMVNWIGGQTTRFRAIVSHAGIFAFRAFHGVTDYPAYFTVEMGGAPWEEGVDYARYSPDTFAHRWKTPALIIHGEKDYRCPISDALSMYEVLEAKGVDVEMLVFPDEGHWITRPRNIRTWYQTWIGFAGARLA